MRHMQWHVFGESGGGGGVEVVGEWRWWGRGDNVDMK